MLERGREGTDRQTGRKTVCLTEGERKRETDRPTDGQTDRQADRLPDRERERERERQTDRQTDIQREHVHASPPFNSPLLNYLTDCCQILWYVLCGHYMTGGVDGGRGRRSLEAGPG